MVNYNTRVQEYVKECVNLFYVFYVFTKAVSITAAIVAILLNIRPLYRILPVLHRTPWLCISHSRCSKVVVVVVVIIVIAVAIVIIIVAVLVVVAVVAAVVATLQ